MAYELRISDWSSDVCSSDLDLVVEYSGVGAQRAIQEITLHAEFVGILLFLIERPRPPGARHADVVAAAALPFGPESIELEVVVRFVLYPDLGRERVPGLGVVKGE